MNHRLLVLVPGLLIASTAPAEAGQTTPAPDPAAANDARAQLGRFQPPPPAPPPAALPGTANQPANNNQAATTGQPRQRRLWRDMLDSLLDLITPRALMSAALLDDPLTTGFGNGDFLEPLPPFDPARLDADSPTGSPSQL